ncbi:MAG: nuclear transport factor 2 family protein [Methyloceanibacter sp.]
MMPIRAAFLVLTVFAATALAEAYAGEAGMIAEVNQAAAALDQAFERQDAEAIKKLMTSDHVAVTPYYPGAQNVDEQIASLADLEFAQEIAGEAHVALLGNDAALRTFKAKQKGSFQGRPLPRHVFVTQLMVKQDGAWLERFYQVTALGSGKHMGKHKRHGCRSLIGTYLTENRPKGESSAGFTSRSLLSLGSGHLMLFTDSGESGEAGFAPFTDGRGSWYCEPGDGDALKIKGTTLDFTAPAAGDPKGGIGRLDFDLTVDGASKTIGGTATLYLLPLGGDPLAEAALMDGREFAITAQRVGAR